jgi:hypothetical protein
MDVLEWELEQVDWHSLATSGGGRAHDVPNALRALASATTEAEAEAAYWRLDNVVVVQAYVFEAGEYVIRPLAQILATYPSNLVARNVLDLLIELTGSDVDPSDLSQGSTARVLSCRSRVREALATIYQLLSSVDPRVRYSALELLEHVEPDKQRLLSLLNTIRATDADEKVRERASWIIDRLN